MSDESELAWTRGDLHRGFALSSKSIAPEVGGDPYRSHAFPLELAERLYQHANKALVMARHAEGRAAIERAIALRESTFGLDHVDTIRAKILGERLAPESDARAERCFALLERMRALGDDRQTAIAGNDISQCVYRQDFDRARMLVEHAVAVLSDGPELDRDLVDARVRELWFLDAAQTCERGLALAPGVIASVERAWGSGHPFVVAPEVFAARMETHVKQFRSARRRLKRVLGIAERGYGVHPTLGHLLRALSANEHASGDVDEAWFYAQRAYDVFEAYAPDRRAEFARPFAEFLFATQRYDQLRALLTSLEQGVPESELVELALYGVFAYYPGDLSRAVRWFERADTRQPSAIKWGRHLLRTLADSELGRRVQDALARGEMATGARSE